jgi:hypothetical protein
MMRRWLAAGSLRAGWAVDVIRLSLTGTGRDGTWLRIRRGGFWIADVRTVAELEAFVPLGSLEPGGLRPRELAGCVRPGRFPALRHQRSGDRGPTSASKPIM